MLVEKPKSNLYSPFCSYYGQGVQRFHLKSLIWEKMSGGIGGQSSRSVCPFHWYPLVEANGPGFVSLFLPSFTISAQLSGSTREQGVSVRLQPVWAFPEQPWGSADTEAGDHQESDKTCRKAWWEGEPAYAEGGGGVSGHPVTSLRFAPSWPVTKISSVSPPAASL